ncbi:MAG: Maf-like protein [Bacteroides sp.]|nr:Maf-like protein [Roseburia sp.]MCM1347406.1 Maf-like protein [Bacteroides sp.]MCM1421881.1 Maf-like protein [Bacteroides sp.]
MLENIQKYKIILASNSPRRKELLAGLGLHFEVRVISGIDESYPEHLVGEEIPMFISSRKADAYQATMADDELLITADTIVYAKGEVLGKPVDADDARRMLDLLSGGHHEVITGVCIMTKQWRRLFATTSHVHFARLTDEEIDYYIKNYRPFDKAGAYGIQEWIGFVGVTGIEGSYFNVMGLPVQRLYTELKSVD